MPPLPVQPVDHQHLSEVQLVTVEQHDVVRHVTKGEVGLLRGTEAAMLEMEMVARAMPKVLLHEHLDGGLRPSTLLELLVSRNMATPAPCATTLTTWFRDRAHSGSLPAYLSSFALTIAAMASPEALERVAFEAAEDAWHDGVVLAEFRADPLAFEAYGVSGEDAVEAMLRGLARSELPNGLIVCGMRETPEERVMRAAELAARYAGMGVVGFDLAGPEFGFPATTHARALRVALDAGLGLTLHAGEADGPERVLEAVRLGARRVGHGVRLGDVLMDPGMASLLEEAKAKDVHLEVCPTSNVHTGAVASVAGHPVVELWRAGVSVSFHTDNRLMSGVTHSGEALALMMDAGLSEEDLVRMSMEAARHSFLAEEVRSAAVEKIRKFSSRRGGSVLVE
ncbi:adenosine deaminase [Gonapodya prolifera JEL478]|uniref:adenosine deaminase n=1 Tax=Gonapodya prolifera (strain JEL478) TaxID=1344416 RepID=A0A139AQZ0_GONPJ|nr:adenosine deaminase [Gonapodya prolifera JEL478]|eukprot:KXS19139.1 adenosine deaminase [Gonapodya prolifera JEL478]